MALFALGIQKVSLAVLFSGGPRDANEINDQISTTVINNHLEVVFPAA